MPFYEVSFCDSVCPDDGTCARWFGASRDTTMKVGFVATSTCIGAQVRVDWESWLRLVGRLGGRWRHRFQGSAGLRNGHGRFDALVVDCGESDQNLLACGWLTGLGFGFSQQAQRKRVSRIFLELRDGHRIAAIEKHYGTIGGVV